MMTLAQKAVALAVLLSLNVVVFVVGVGLGGIFGLALAVVFALLSAVFAWRVLSM